jgi:hypothetical protein
MYFACKHVSYAVLMEIRCKMAIHFDFFYMNGSSLHFLLNRKYDLQQIHYHLNLIPGWDKELKDGRKAPFTLHEYRTGS